MPAYDPIEVPCDERGAFAKDVLPARVPAMYCPPAWDVNRNIEAVLDASGVDTGEYILNRLMQRHEWRLELHQEVQMPAAGPTLVAVDGRRGGPTPEIVSQLLFYCIHCTTTQMPRAQNMVIGLWDQAAMLKQAQDEQAAQRGAAQAAQGDAEASGAPTPLSIAPLTS